MESLTRMGEEFLAAGGQRAAFDEVAHGGLRAIDPVKQDGEVRPVESRALVLRALRPGILMEYQCYDELGRIQASAILCFET